MTQATLYLTVSAPTFPEFEERSAEYDAVLIQNAIETEIARLRERAREFLRQRRFDTVRREIEKVRRLRLYAEVFGRIGWPDDRW